MLQNAKYASWFLHIHCTYYARNYAGIIASSLYSRLNFVTRHIFLTFSEHTLQLSKADKSGVIKLLCCVCMEEWSKPYLHILHSNEEKWKLLAIHWPGLHWSWLLGLQTSGFFHRVLLIKCLYWIFCLKKMTSKWFSTMSISNFFFTSSWVSLSMKLKSWRRLSKLLDLPRKQHDTWSGNYHWCLYTGILW